MHPYCWLAGVMAAGVVLAGESPTVRRKLRAAETVDTVPCAKGYAFFYRESGRLKSCAVAMDYDFGQARVPAKSRVFLTPDGAPRWAFLHHNTVIGGLTCRGFGHFFSTAFHENGRLKTCWIKETREVDGVLCRKGAVHFDDRGQLRDCRRAAVARTESKK